MGNRACCANIATGLRAALPEQPVDEKTVSGEPGSDKGKPGEPRQPGSGEQIRRGPKRFFGSITLDPDRAGLQVAKIAEEILLELTRQNGAGLKLTLEIEASAAPRRRC